MLVGMTNGGVGRDRRGRVLGVGIIAITSGLGVAAAGSGCSSDYESREIPQAEGGPSRDAGGGGDATPGERCPRTGAVDPTTLGWKPPTPPQEGKCQADDVTAMRDFLVKQPGATNEELLAFVKNRDGTCADCIFADADLQTWPPAPVKAGKVVTFNVGACYAVVTGLQRCGQAVQNAWDCAFDACLECGSSQALETCRAKARSTTCKAYQDRSNTECGATSSADSVCGSPFDSIRVQCVTSAADAGKL